MVLRSVVLASLVLACQPAVEDADDAVAPGDVEVYPPEVGLGATISFTLTSDRAFGEVAPAVSFGPDLVVEEVRLDAPTLLTATVSVPEASALGLRDVQVDADGWSRVVADAVRVNAGWLTVVPDRVPRGELVRVEIIGERSAWGDHAGADFGPGIEIVELDVSAPEHAVAWIGVHAEALPGPRTVRVDRVVRHDALTVEAAGVSASFEGGPLPQAETIDFTLRGQGTAWSGETRVVVYDLDGSPSNDVALVELRPIDATNVFGRMRASNAAVPGVRDVLVITGEARTWIPDALEVIETEPPLDEAVLSLRFNLDREVDESGRVSEELYAAAAFFVPLDPPCGSPPPPGPGGDGAYDGVRLMLDHDAAQEDCPEPLRLDAGPAIWLRASDRVLPLRRERSVSGGIRYVGGQLEVSDYPFGARLDLVTSGEGRVPQTELVGIVHTVPGDVRLMGGAPLDAERADGLPVRWLPTGSYPDAELGLSLAGVVAGQAREGRLVTRPWDDGEYRFEPRDLFQLEPGRARLVLESSVEGPEFTLPFSELVQPQITSRVSVSRTLYLE